MSRRAQRKSRLQTYDQIKLDPLIDTLFFLLIIFMVTAPLLEYSMDVNPPEFNANELPKEDPHAKVVDLKTNGVVVFNRAEMTKNEFIGNIASMLAQDSKTRLFLRADRTLSYGEVVDFLAEIHRTGFKDVSLITREEPR